MATITFDTLKLARKLGAAAFSREQATGATEALTETLAESVDLLATRADIDEVRRDLREVELRVEAKIEANKAELLRWAFGAMVAQTGVIVALLKLLP